MIPLLNIAQTAVYTAGRNINNILYSEQWQTMDDHSLVSLLSKLQKRADQQISKKLATAYPSHGLNTDDSASGYSWYWDVLPETTNFIYRLPQLSIVMSCYHKERTICSIIFNPLTQEKYSAVQGKGAQYNGRRMRLNKTTQLEHALISVPTSTQFASLQNKAKHVRNSGSMNLDIADLALGRLDAILLHDISNRATFLACCLFMQESGGLVGDLDGGTELILGKHIAAANPQLFSVINKAYKNS